ncbi:MAG: NAD-dependent malic enzyme [Gemmatimonadota bacterium]
MHAASETSTTTGFEVLQNPTLNRGTGFTAKQRELLGLRGLLPHRVCSQDVQMERILENLRRKATDIERYIFLLALHGRNERLFYRTAVDHIEEIMPLIYTPTVGQACKEYAHIFRQSKGFYITPEDRGGIRRLLDNWPRRDVRVIVVTDGERILGLGDLGSNGMGIPVGKLSLYSACAGIHPEQCMPVMLDVGTNNEELLSDPLYLGIPTRRITGDAYLELVDEFVEAVKDAFPDALIQFEDFLTPNAYLLLNRYRDDTLCFNDDIQGTAAVVLAGVRASLRVSQLAFEDLRVLFLGAGSAATGTADLMVAALVEAGLPEAEARRRLSFVDAAGLVTSERDDLMPHNLPYAHEHAPADFLGAIEAIQPHVLIGATGHPGTFTREVVSLMAKINERPAIFALSNPTSLAECTAEQAYEWSAGRAIFASGSPFPPVHLDGREFRPSQANNAYVFPGIGLGAVSVRATRVTHEMFLAAAAALAVLVSEDDLAAGAVYPPLTEIRSVSLNIAVAVAETAYEQELAREPRPDDLETFIAAQMYDPTY